MDFSALTQDKALALHWVLVQLAAINLLAGILAYACVAGARRLLDRTSTRAPDSSPPRADHAPASQHVTSRIRATTVLLTLVLTNRWLLPRVAVFRPLPSAVELLLRLATIGAVAWLLLQAGRGVRSWLDDRFDVAVADNLRSRQARTQIAFAERIFDVIVVALAIAVTIGQFESGRRLSAGLLASAGVASLVIGFAAQRTLANLLAGFQIAFTSPIRIDDAVVVEDEWGWIEEIALTYVVVRVWDRRRLILPITYFVEKPFQNWTRKSGQILGSVFLEVAHHAPFEALEKELARLLAHNNLWDGDAQVLQVVEMKERCVQLRALMTARNSPQCWDLRCAVRRGLIEFLVKNYPDALPSARLQITGESAARAEPRDSWIAPAKQPASAPHHEV